ncbi:hypothetical protein K2173_011165 [Erythroxylum novogranatense]|uniref:Mannan endo-1,4-beta-mannosidase n=1 Tax=Erythroxylum novogranatense TaxID=1862640 RepID=A0AAV8T7E1_9ROSI|nr:hypothetical protein K2173_011165 [Erythroxylum novogranatense]
MKTYSTRMLLAICVLPLMLCLSRGNVNSSFRIRAVNLGGWLLAEGWMTPSLFDGIPNNDFLDGTELQFRSVKFNRYLCAESGGGSLLVANRLSASTWETFKVWRISQTSFNFRVLNKQFLGLDTKGNGVNMIAVSNIPGNSETFEIVRDSKSKDMKLVRIRASNGLFLQVRSGDLVTADFTGGGLFLDNDPSVFEMTITGQLQGEFQVTNGYGPSLAPKVMREHWRTYIVEYDLKFISQNGLNAVRIPVGWWIASDPTPPRPYVGGSLQALDNAFSWATKYGLKVIIDLHAAPGSQNGWEHSSSRDGFIEWGQTDENIQQTVRVIEFLTARYAKSPSLYAVELINEPRGTGVSLESLTKYYKAGYNAVRKHSSVVYVVMSNRLSQGEPTELFPLASGLKGSVIDVHFYSYFEDKFNTMSVQDNIDYIYNSRVQNLNELTISNGPLVFVGEWVTEWRAMGAGREEYLRFSKAQVDVYGRASFGWAYWSLKNVNHHWSLEWMIKNGYFKL